MTTYDVLSIAETPLRMLINAGVDVRMVKHLQMFRDYERLTKEGHKNMYIVHFLSEQYGVSVPSIYRIVKNLRQSLT